MRHGLGKRLVAILIATTAALAVRTIPAHATLIDTPSVSADASLFSPLLGGDAGEAVLNVSALFGFAVIRPPADVSASKIEPDIASLQLPELIDRIAPAALGDTPQASGVPLAMIEAGAPASGLSKIPGDVDDAPDVFSRASMTEIRRTAPVRQVEIVVLPPLFPEHRQVDLSQVEAWQLLRQDLARQVPAPAGILVLIPALAALVAMRRRFAR